MLIAYSIKASFYLFLYALFRFYVYRKAKKPLSKVKLNQINNSPKIQAFDSFLSSKEIRVIKKLAKKRLIPSKTYGNKNDYTGRTSSAGRTSSSAGSMPTFPMPTARRSGATSMPTRSSTT